MAQSKCGSCGKSRFEVREAPVMLGTDYKWFFVQCADCGVVVGVLDYFPLSSVIARLDSIEKRLGKR